MYASKQYLISLLRDLRFDGPTATSPTQVAC